MDGIVIGVDGSDGAAEALRWGVDHAAGHHRPVTALMVWNVRDQPRFDPDAPFDVHYGWQEARHDLERMVVESMGGVPEGLRLRARCGTAAPELIEAGRTADLLVVGARGSGGFTGLLVGSVSREVLNGATCPVAIVRGQPADPCGPIVVGVDRSAASRRALQWALGEGRARRRRVVAMTTWHIVATTDGHRHLYLDPASLLAGAERALDREVDRCDAHGLPAPVERRVEDGTPAAALVRAGRSASMLVVGSHGHRAAPSRLLGAISDQVTHHAACPVVVVPPPSDDQR